MAEDRWFCQACQLECPLSERIKIMRRSRGGVIVPQYRCVRCYTRKRKLKGGKNASV